MDSKIMQFITSRYDADKTDYSDLKFDKHSNTGRLINALDLVSQVGRTVLSTGAALTLSIPRILFGLGGFFVITPAMLIANGMQCLLDKNKNFSAFQSTFKTAYFFARNFETGICTLAYSIPEALIWRTTSIAADIGGIICPQLGKMARDAENEFVDRLNNAMYKDTIILIENSSDNKISKFIFEHVWPRADKWFWVASDELKDLF